MGFAEMGSLTTPPAGLQASDTFHQPTRFCHPCPYPSSLPHPHPQFSGSSASDRSSTNTGGATESLAL